MRRKRLKFLRGSLELERIVGLIYFQKTDYNFDKDLYYVIDLLRKYSDCIKAIGCSVGNNNIVIVQFEYDPRNLTSEELCYISTISC